MSNSDVVKSWFCSRKPQSSKRSIDHCLSDNAHVAIGKLSPGCEIFCLTKGQFSLINMIVALLDQTGPAHVDVATWTAAKREIDSAHSLLKTGRILKLRFLVDFSFPRRQPKYCAQLRARFGDDSIRVTKTHAKFILVRNDTWNLVVRTSMNLNKNARLEVLEISDDPLFAQFLLSVVDELFDSQENSDIEKMPGFHHSQFEKFGLETCKLNWDETDDLGLTLDDPSKPGFSLGD